MFSVFLVRKWSSKRAAPAFDLRAPEICFELAPILVEYFVAVEPFLFRPHENQASEEIGLRERPALGVEGVENLLRVVTFGQGDFHHAKILLQRLQQGERRFLRSLGGLDGGRDDP